MDVNLKKYKLTWELLENKIPESLQGHLEELYKELERPKAKTVGKLRKLIKKYPNNPQLRNYLSAVYNQLGENEKMKEVNDALLKAHPDYFFAKVNKANQYIKEEKPEKVKELFNESFDLQEVYPERDVFHISEFLSMQSLAARYFALIDDNEQVEKRLGIMQDVETDSIQYQEAVREIFKINLEKSRLRFEEEERKRITPKNTFRPQKNIFTVSFQKKETQTLYQYEEDLPKEFVENYLSLDRVAIIADLEGVLKKSYLNPAEGDKSFAVVHALFLLGELEAEESLPVVLDMMRQDESYFETVFGDIFSEWAWIPLLKMGKDRLDDLEAYLMLPGLCTSFRIEAQEALVQMTHHYPEKKEAVLHVFRKLLDFFVQAKIEDNVIDSEFNGFLIWDLVELKQAEFLPQIKILYEKGYVSETVCGSFDEIEKDILEQDKYKSEKRLLQDIKNIYKELSSAPASHNDAEGSTFPLFSPFHSSSSSSMEEEDIYKREMPKVGRNDPCPCGSGNKFKKCCLGKGIYD